MIRKLAAILVCSFLVGAHAWAQDSYPRLGGVLIGGQQDYWTSTYQNQIATLNIAIIAAYPRWGSGHGTSTEQVIKQIKAKNSKTRIFMYAIAGSQLNPVSTVWPGLQTKLDQNHWWLYQSGSGLTKVRAIVGAANNYSTNITPFSKKDSAGLTYNKWIAGYLADQLGKPSPSADGIYTDDVNWRPRVQGDWNMDGSIDSSVNPTVGSWLRQGHAAYVDTLRARMPNKLQLANIADWGGPETTLTEYKGKFNGGIMEGMLGKSYSIEKSAGWAAMMARYRKTMAVLASPKLALFQMSGSPTDYQGMRYGLASTLMDDGYFAFNDSSKGYYGVTHFDEYGVKLGVSKSSPPTSAWKSGVYRRDFANGIVLVNPKGNGVRTVSLETSYKKIRGTQAPSVNSGATVTSVTLQDRDGIILLRPNVQAAPAAPELIIE